MRSNEWNVVCKQKFKQTVRQSQSTNWNLIHLNKKNVKRIVEIQLQGLDIKYRIMWVSRDIRLWVI